MNLKTADHLMRWLHDHVIEDERDDVLSKIVCFEREHPEIIEGHSWPEIRIMAERMFEKRCTKQRR